mmetsp:Transcript_39304/g.60030  ORF Transcript_39304/g.60030 Transcript_39304/m.60030 type:complete len:115 (+) Transcript_39304:336-680(+)
MRYNFERTLGEGAFGKVKIASLIENPTKKFAIKSIPRKLLDLGAKDQPDLEFDEKVMQKLLETEIQVVMDMDHPNIVKFYQCVYDNAYINIVMELIKGTTLSDFLEKKKRVSED